MSHYRHRREKRTRIQRKIAGLEEEIGYLKNRNNRLVGHVTYLRWEMRRIIASDGLVVNEVPVWKSTATRALAATTPSIP